MNLKRYLGFSIIEMMISISIGLVIVAAVLQIYASNRTTFAMQEGLARLQENGRYASFILNKDIRMSGFIGCANQQKVIVSNLITSPAYTADITNPMRGYDSPSSSFNPALPTNLVSKALPGSDVIEIRQAAPSSTLLNADMASSSASISVYPKLSILANDLLIITDCVVGDLFVASAGSSSSTITHTLANNTQAALSTPYKINAQVLRYLYYVYYVKNTGRVNDTGSPVYALVRQNQDGSEDEIAEGVEKMRVLYGVDTNTDKSVDTYQTAAEVEAANNWDKVNSVHIKLLLSTPEQVNEKAQSYTFNGITTTPTDRRLRKEWDTYITLRNRGL